MERGTSVSGIRWWCCLFSEHVCKSYKVKHRSFIGC